MLRVSFNLQEYNAFMRIIRPTDRSLYISNFYRDILADLKTIEPHYLLFIMNDFATLSMRTEYFDF